MTFNPITNPVDYILLEGQQSPGLAEIVNADSPRKWDKRGGYALEGATLWYRGLDLSAFSIKFRLFTSQDFEQWAVWSRILKRPPARVRPRASAIVHPQLAELGIKSVVVLNLKQAVQEDDGVWMYECQFSDWRKVKLALLKPEGSKTQQSNDPVDRRIEQLTQQVQELAAG
jgi:hypothetical protein